MESAVEVVISSTSVDIENNSLDNKNLAESSSWSNGKKRSSEDGDMDTNQHPNSRIRLQSVSAVSKDGKVGTNGKKSKERWRMHRMSEDYVNLVGDIMYPRIEFGPYGYNPEKGRFPMDRMNTLGLLSSPLRRPTVIDGVYTIEKWSPFEVSIFEAALTLYGKNFHQVQKFVKTKTVKEVIEFYYDWKKTSHYKQWKDSYKPDDRESG